MAEERGMIQRTMGESPFTSLQRAMNQLFEDFMTRPFGRLGAELGMMPGRMFGGAERFEPRMDVFEDDESVHVTAELPGIDPKNVQLTVSQDVLTLEGEKKREHEEKGRDWYAMERSFGAFRRSIRMPVPVDADHAEARWHDGVLDVRVPKAGERTRTRRIEIKKG